MRKFSPKYVPENPPKNRDAYYLFTIEATIDHFDDLCVVIKTIFSSIVFVYLTWVFKASIENDLSVAEKWICVIIFVLMAMVFWYLSAFYSRISTGYVNLYKKCNYEMFDGKYPYAPIYTKTNNKILSEQRDTIKQEEENKKMRSTSIFSHLFAKHNSTFFLVMLLGGLALLLPILFFKSWLF